jgi:predicted SnoaL-like aldol condensation-catalyzing enzyme
MTATEGPRTTQFDDRTDANRAIALEFLTRAAQGGAREAMHRLAAPDFLHHNPWFASDAESLAAAMDENARANPQKDMQVLRTVAEGSLVALHARVVHAPGDRPAAVVHVFSTEDGLIRELWDVGQEEPVASPNSARMF